MTVNYSQMAVKLWGSKTPGNAQDVRDLNLLKNKKKVIKMLVIVVVLFCVAWFPLQMYNILQVDINKALSSTSRQNKLRERKGSRNNSTG